MMRKLVFILTLILAACGPNRDGEEKQAKPEGKPVDRVTTEEVDVSIVTDENEGPDRLKVFVLPVSNGYEYAEILDVPSLLESILDSCSSLEVIQLKAAKYQNQNLLGIWRETDVKSLRDSLGVDVLVTSSLMGMPRMAETKWGYEVKVYYQELYWTALKQTDLSSSEALKKDLISKDKVLRNDLVQNTGFRCR